jgi:hypothetical protein
MSITWITTMSESPHSSSNRERRLQKNTIWGLEPSSQSRKQIAPELQLAIVAYDDSPDRGTFYPPHLTEIERMETWMSVDMSVVVDLQEWR